VTLRLVFKNQNLDSFVNLNKFNDPFYFETLLIIKVYSRYMYVSLTSF